jgi:hypothetical protein
VQAKSAVKKTVKKAEGKVEKAEKVGIYPLAPFPPFPGAFNTLFHSLDSLLASI